MAKKSDKDSSRTSRAPRPVDPSIDTRQTPTTFERHAMPTLTDPEELEQARILSMGSKPPRVLTPAPGGDALNLVNARAASDAPPTQAVPTPAPAPDSSPATGILRPASIAELDDLIGLGDYSGALDIAERLLEKDPENAKAAQAAETCRTTLRKMYAARIGPLDRVPTVQIPREQLRWLSIDHRTGFVLSLVDGVSTAEMILDVSGMPELDALRILAELVQQRIVAFR